MSKLTCETPMNYQHLLRLSSPLGIYQRCEGRVPLIHFGFRVDDVARTLIVIERDREAPEAVRDISETCMNFLADAQSSNGLIASRRTNKGDWHGEIGIGDHWGLALWAWGTVIGHSDNLDFLERAIECFHRSAQSRTPLMRPMAYAALGAAEYVQRFPANDTALDLLADTKSRLSRDVTQGWPWPESRLTYINAVLPHALIVAGHHLGDQATLSQGLMMLEWLVALETRDGYLSPVTSSGWSPGDDLPTFHQQPIEVAHLVDACIDAHHITGDDRWLEPARLGGLWFYGLNDSGVWMHDPQSGAGYDGLNVYGRKDVQGAEATLAYLSTVGQLHRHRQELLAAKEAVDKQVSVF